MRADDVRRVRLILLLASGKQWMDIEERLDCTRAYINKWNKRFREGRIEGLTSRKAPGGRRTVRTPQFEARVRALMRQPPSDGSTHWSTWRLARRLGVSDTAVHRVWKHLDLQPHRLERYLASNDPDFKRKAADVIGLYLNPPEHAAVFSVDEKTAVQALDRTVPVLPLSPGRAERHGFEYKRNGTRSLLAALDTRTGTVVEKTVRRVNSAAFVDFLGEIVANQPASREIHVIADNLSAHKTKRVEAFVAAHPNFHLHYTPTYSSWLNQIELWFGKIKRDLLARGIFKSTSDLNRKIMRFIRAHNRVAKPYRWTYSDLASYPYSTCGYSPLAGSHSSGVSRKARRTRSGQQQQPIPSRIVISNRSEQRQTDAGRPAQERSVVHETLPTVDIGPSPEATDADAGPVVGERVGEPDERGLPESHISGAPVEPTEDVGVPRRSVAEPGIVVPAF